MFDLEKFRAGDHDHFAKLMRSYGSLVMRVCTSFGNSEEHVEDLFQEIWTTAYQRRRSFSGSGSFKAWLTRLASNRCISDYRARKTRSKAVEEFWESGAGVEVIWHPIDPAESAERKELRDRLLAAVDDLPDREREAICLRILGERPPSEVAKIMAIDKTTVRSNTNRGLHRLAQRLKDAEL